MIFIQLLGEKEVASKYQQKCAIVEADIFALYVQNYIWQMHASARLQVAHPSISNDTQQKQRDISLALIPSSDKQTKMFAQKNVEQTAGNWERERKRTELNRKIAMNDNNK